MYRDVFSWLKIILFAYPLQILGKWGLLQTKCHNMSRNHLIKAHGRSDVTLRPATALCWGKHNLHTLKPTQGKAKKQRTVRSRLGTLRTDTPTQSVLASPFQDEHAVQQSATRLEAPSKHISPWILLSFAHHTVCELASRARWGRMGLPKCSPPHTRPPV